MKLYSFSTSKRWLIPNPNLIFNLFGWGKGQGEGKEGRSDRNAFQKERVSQWTTLPLMSEEKAPHFMQKKKERMVVIKTQHRLEHAAAFQESSTISFGYHKGKKRKEKKGKEKKRKSWFMIWLPWHERPGLSTTGKWQEATSLGPLFDWICIEVYIGWLWLLEMDKMKFPGLYTQKINRQTSNESEWNWQFMGNSGGWNNQRRIMGVGGLFSHLQLKWLPIKVVLFIILFIISFLAFLCFVRLK